MDLVYYLLEEECGQIRLDLSQNISVFKVYESYVHMEHFVDKGVLVRERATMIIEALENPKEQTEKKHEYFQNTNALDKNIQGQTGMSNEYFKQKEEVEDVE